MCAMKRFRYFLFIIAVVAMTGCGKEKMPINYVRELAPNEVALGDEILTMNTNFTDKDIKNFLIKPGYGIVRKELHFYKTDHKGMYFVKFWDLLTEEEKEHGVSGNDPYVCPPHDYFEFISDELCNIYRISSYYIITNCPYGFINSIWSLGRSSVKVVAFYPPYIVFDAKGTKDGDFYTRELYEMKEIPENFGTNHTIEIRPYDSL